jgi:oligopeptide/dipeptide ABC transporter ATP-binding protein
MANKNDEDAQTSQPSQGLYDRSPRGSTVLKVEHLVKNFSGPTRLSLHTSPPIQAVSDVSFVAHAGETLGIVGESGCGKTTTARSIVQLIKPTSGRILFRGHDLGKLDRVAKRRVRQEIQYVFQDPSTAFNPRMTVHDVIAEPLRIHGRYKQGGADRVAELLRLVSMEPEHGERYPHEFSGGQRQRIGIVRAIALDAQLLILDEPVSALDTSVQAQVINLLKDLQDRLDLAYVFVAHDLSMIRHICDRVAVMYLGKIVEMGTKTEIFEQPSHPYTQALLSAVPIRDPSLRDSRERILLEGDIPSPSSPPSGCRFRTRCWKAKDICAEEEPVLLDRSGIGHPSACHFATPSSST